MHSNPATANPVYKIRKNGQYHHFTNEQKKSIIYLYENKLKFS